MYTKRYECFCKSMGGDLFRIEIYKRGIHVSEEVRLGGDMLEIERTAEDQLDPISVTKATVYLYTERDGLFEDLYSVGEHGAVCRIYKNDALYYIGSLDAEQWKAPYSYKQGYITQVAFSDLSPLKRLEYTPRGLVSVVDFVKQCVTKATYPDSLFGAPVLQLLTNLSVSGYKHQWSLPIDAVELNNISALTSAERLTIAEGSMSALNPTVEASSLSRAYINTEVFLDDDKEGERKAVWWDALHDALKSLSLYLVQREGKFYLFDVDALKERGVKETLVAMGKDAELGIEKTYNKIKVELEKREPTQLYKHEFSEDDFAEEVTNWRFNRIDLEADRLVASHNVAFHMPKSDTVIRGGALYAKLIPHTMGSEETYVCLFAKPRRRYEHNPIIGSFIHELAHTFPFIKPYPIEKMASIANLRGGNGVYCTPMIPIPTRTADNLAKYQMALSLEMLVGMDYSLTQRNSDDPEYDGAIGNHIKKIIPKKIQHAYAFAFIRAYDKEGNVVRYLSNYGGVPTEKQPFYRPIWVETPTLCCIQFGAEEFKLGSFQSPNEQISALDISTKYGEVYDKRFIFPLPPVGCSIDVVVVDKIHLSLQEPKYNFFTSLDDLMRKDVEEAKLGILLESYVQWVLMRGLAVDLVRYDGRDFEHKKIAYRSSVSPEAHEELEETILLDTSKELSPTSLSALRDEEGRNLNPECVRGLVRGTLGELRVSHVFSRCAHLHYTLSGTYRTPKSFARLIDPHKKKEFRVVEEREQPLLGQSKLSMVEINRDRATSGGGTYDIVCMGESDAAWSIDRKFVGRVVGNTYKESIQPISLISGLVAEQEAVASDLSLVREEFTGSLTATVNSVFTERKGELKGEKGEDGRSVSIADLGISWQDSQLVIGGVVSPNLKGERGEDAPMPNILSGAEWVSGYIDENNGTTIGSSATDMHSPEFYPIHSGAEIRLSSDYVNGAIGGWSLLFFYDRAKNFLSARRYTNGRNAVELSLSAPDNAYYLRISKLSSAHNVRLHTLLRGFDGKSVSLSELVSNTEFMQHTAQKVSEVGRFVTQEVVNSTIASQIAPLQNERRMVSRQGSLPYTVVLDNPESHDVGKVIEYDFIPSLQCMPGDGRVYSPYEVFAGNMVELARNNNTIDAPNRNACYNNHYEFKVVQYDSKKVWLWANYEAIKFAETEQQVRTQATQIAGAIADTQRLSGESINIRSRILELNEMNVSQGLSIASLQGEVMAIKQSKMPIHSNKTSTVVATRGTFNMTHNDTPTTFRLPTPSEGLVCYVWANHWVSGTKTLYKPISPSNCTLINTNTAMEVNSIALIKDHIYQCIAINSSTWLVTDLSGRIA